MQKKIYISVIFATLLALSGWSQSPAITIESAKLYEQKELQLAKQKIDGAILLNAGKQDPYTWHVRGHIYKELYKVVDKRDRTSANRERSCRGFLYSDRTRQG